MNPRRSLVILSALTALSLPLVLGDGAVGATDRADREDAPAGLLMGSDGLTYLAADKVVEGQNGMMFLGHDFDSACGDGASFKRGLHKLAALARIVEKSGRRVLFTVAPNKTAVEPQAITVLPHAACDEIGLTRQARLLDRFDDENYVPLRKKLAHTTYPYWRTDAHWSTVGASVFAQEVAARLDRRVAREQRYAESTRTLVGELELILGGSTPETAPALVPANGVTTRPAPGSPAFDPTFHEFQLDNSWISSPARKTIGGDTLLVGDSFMYSALEPMRNVFRRGRSIWLTPTSVDAVLQAIRAADTVVFEVVQRFVAISPLASSKFRRQVARALVKD